jgi:hypothetical protein
MMITARYAHTWKSALATGMLAFVATPMAVLPIGIVGYGLLGLVEDGRVPGAFLVAAVVVMPLLVLVTARGMVKAGELRVTLDDVGYTREQVGKTSATIAWAGTKGVSRRLGLLVVRVPGGAIASVPDSAFSVEQLAEIDAFLQRRKAATPAPGNQGLS